MEEKKETVGRALHRGELPPGFREILPEALSVRIFDAVGREGMLVTAETEDGMPNPMTATWGGFGVLFGEPVVFCFIRPSRYTHTLIKNTRCLSLSFFGDAGKTALKVCGSMSGRDGDKTSAAGLSPFRLPEGGFSYLTARLSIAATVICEVPLDIMRISESERHRYYQNGDVHTVFVSRVDAVYLREG